MGIILLVAVGQLAGIHPNPATGPGMIVAPRPVATAALISGEPVAVPGVIGALPLAENDALAGVAVSASGGDSSAAAEKPTDQGAIVVSARRHHAPGDPMEAVNVKSYAVTQSVDKAIVGPIAMGYRDVVPSPIRSGLHNAILNLREPTIFLNYMLQIKPGKAAETAGRFAINSTMGIAGFIDIAKRRPFSLPHRPNGFADSFGYYGIKPGPYMFLPLVGPTTVRDLIGGGLDRLVLPLAVGSPFNQLVWSVPTGVVSALDHRLQIDAQLHAWRASDDPYASLRSAYLLHRQAEIDGLKGKLVHADVTSPAP